MKGSLTPRSLNNVVYTNMNSTSFKSRESHTLSFGEQGRHSKSLPSPKRPTSTSLRHLERGPLNLSLIAPLELRHIPNNRVPSSCNIPCRSTLTLCLAYLLLWEGGDDKEIKNLKLDGNIGTNNKRGRRKEEHSLISKMMSWKDVLEKGGRLRTHCAEKILACTNLAK